MTNPLDHIRRALEAEGDRYLILDELGRGAAAIVYLAEDRKLHRQVALKVLRPEVAADVGASRFIREIETVAQLSHPGILHLLDSGEAGGLPWFSMPYMQGESLRDRLAREQQLPLDEALDYARDIAGALAYAHSLGIVHRDIKPGNILLSGGRAVVADFGVARAISAAIEGESERPGELFGTPLYMSPEQFTGSVRVDRRSDLYSLGCVLYEMIAGYPPFTGPTAEALRAQHLTEAPPPLSQSQRNVDPELVDVVERLLAKAPADRFVTAQQLIDALPQKRRVSGRTERVRQPVRWGRWMGFASGAAALVAAVTVLAARVLNPPIDGLYAVLSAEGRLAGQDSRPVASVRAELERWDDAELRVVPEIQVVDQVRERGAPENLDALVALARRLRAARLVRLETRPTGEAVSLTLALYEPTSEAGTTALRTETVACAAADAACDSSLAVATRRLLVPGGGPFEPRDAGTASLAAYRALVEGNAAYARWDLPQAEVRFLDATRFDPRFARAHLSLAEVRWWLGRPGPEWRNEAAAFLSTARDPGRRSAVRARALLALADGRYPEACREFDELVARDSLDFAAWYGRGECLRLDKVVLKNPRSPSGWVFRASVDEALASYERALSLAPGIHRGFGARAYERAAGLFYVDEYDLRPGYLEAHGVRRDSIAFAAWPDLLGDTLTFIPWPLTEIISDAPRTRAANQFRAVLRNRSRVAELTAQWVRSFPESPVAHLGRAEALESLREGGQEGGWREVLHHAAEARRLAGTDRPLWLSASAAAVRQQVKAEQYADAVALADTLLAGPVPTDTGSARRLASVAALTGRIQQAVALTREGARDFERLSLDGQRFLFPTPLSEAALALLVYSSFGVPADSIVALERRVEQLTAGFVNADQLLAARTTVLARPATLAFPTMGLRPAHRSVDPRHQGVRRQVLQADGRQADVRASLRASAENFGWRPSSNNVDGVYLEALAYLAVGDTAAAIKLSGTSLTSLAGYGRDLLGSDVEGSLPQMATLPRLMALRAELAALDRDTETARRWARAVTTLWAGADPPLQPVVARMAELLVQSVPPR